MLLLRSARHLARAFEAQAQGVVDVMAPGPLVRVRV